MIRPFFNAIVRGISTHAFPRLGPSRLAEKLQRLMKLYTFSIVLQMIKIICAICERNRGADYVRNYGAAG